jgi:DNA-binding response OmpR family regulator
MGKAMRILVVDDDAITRDAIAETLRQERYEVLTAANGRKALKILAKRKCRLVVTDWMMPEVNGINLCRAIRNADIEAYVIMMSSLNDPRDAALAISSGANDFLSKPWDRRDLLARVRVGELAIETGSCRRATEVAVCGD